MRSHRGHVTNCVCVTKKGGKASASAVHVFVCVCDESYGSRLDGFMGVGGGDTYDSNFGMRKHVSVNMKVQKNVCMLSSRLVHMRGHVRATVNARVALARSARVFFSYRHEVCHTWFMFDTLQLLALQSNSCCAGLARSPSGTYRASRALVAPRYSTQTPPPCAPS